jgi:hypothetical protein
MSFFERHQEQELQVEQQEEYLIGKIEELKSLNEEHEKLKYYHTSLIGKHKNLEKEYACATNVFSYVDSLEMEHVNSSTLILNFGKQIIVSRLLYLLLSF